jgi:hypothetical protein
MRRGSFLAALALAALVGCGGDDSQDGKTFDDTAASTAISSQQAQPIIHTFTEAGTYTLTLTGTYSGPADVLQVWWSFSGQGTTDGNTEPSYTVTNGSVAVNQSINVTLTGAGPWQLTIASQVVGPTTGALTNLRLHGLER